MAISGSRSEQFEAEIRRRISLHLENIRDTAPDGPALGLEDLRSLWEDEGSYEELEEIFGSRS